MHWEDLTKYSGRLPVPLHSSFIDTIFSYENLHVVRVVVPFLKPQNRKLAGDRQRSILGVIIQNYQGRRKIKLCSTPRLHFSQISLELQSSYWSSDFVTNSFGTRLVKNHESQSRTNESQLKKKKRVRNGKCLGVYVTKQLIWRQTSKFCITVYWNETSPSILKYNKG